MTTESHYLTEFRDYFGLRQFEIDIRLLVIQHAIRQNTFFL